MVLQEYHSHPCRLPGRLPLLAISQLLPQDTKLTSSEIHIRPIVILKGPLSNWCQSKLLFALPLLGGANRVRLTPKETLDRLEAVFIELDSWN